MFDIGVCVGGFASSWAAFLGHARRVLCVCVSGEQACRATLAACGCLSPRLQLFVKTVFLVAAARVAKDSGTVCCKQHARLRNMFTRLDQMLLFLWRKRAQEGLVLLQTSCVAVLSAAGGGW
jgi:hypothetical protein